MNPLYGLCLLAFCGVVAAQNGPFEVPSDVWWRGNAVTFHKYNNDGACQRIYTNDTATNGYAGIDQQNGWFGGLERFTFKMDSSTCLKVPSKKLGNPGNTWVKIRFDNGYNGCALGYNSGSQWSILYYNDPECRDGFQQSVVDFWSMSGAMIPRDGECFYDRGGSSNPPQGQIYYRVFCDVVVPTKTYIQPITNNITVVNNVPTIVKPQDLIPLIMSLIQTNASLFKPLMIRDVIPTPPTPSPPILAYAPINSNRSSGCFSMTVVSAYIAAILVAFYHLL